MDHIRRTAQHATKLAKHHRAIAAAVTKCFGKAKKAAKPQDLDLEALNELLESFLENHSAIADEHAAYAEHCAECADAQAEKAARDRLSKRTGDGAAVQPGERLPAPPHGFVAIPRGAKALPSSDAPANVPLELQKLFSTADEESIRQ
jgi:hypothetical protein